MTRSHSCNAAYKGWLFPVGHELLQISPNKSCLQDFTILPTPPLPLCLAEKQKPTDRNFLNFPCSLLCHLQTYRHPSLPSCFLSQTMGQDSSPSLIFSPASFRIPLPLDSPETRLFPLSPLPPATLAVSFSSDCILSDHGPAQAFFLKTKPAKTFSNDHSFPLPFLSPSVSMKSWSSLIVSTSLRSICSSGCFCAQSSNELSLLKSLVPNLGHITFVLLLSMREIKN